MASGIEPPSLCGPEEQFFRFLREGRFMLQRSKSTGNFLFYPRTHQPGTGNSDLEWVEASGKGEIYAATTIHRQADQGGDFNISIIDLMEGPHLLSRVLGVAPESVSIGMPVKARIERPSWAPASDQPVVVFYPVRE